MTSRSCVEIERVCDGQTDCMGGDDEQQCGNDNDNDWLTLHENAGIGFTEQNRVYFLTFLKF